jgi:hypothetical protein
MSLDDSGMALAGQATRALGSLQRYGHALRPPDADENLWRLQVLDELTRTGQQLAEAIAHVVGEGDPGVVWMVRELTSAIELHCDRVVRAVRERPGPVVSERVVPFPTPYAPAPPDPARVASGSAVPAPVGDVARQTAVDPVVARTVISTAAELLMRRHGHGVDTAYATILDRARESGRTTYEVAVQLMDDER